MTPEAQLGLEERPRVGDRVKLIGTHRYAGFSGVYLADRAFYEGGGTVPVVKLNHQGTTIETWVHDPERQMRKA